MSLLCVGADCTLFFVRFCAYFDLGLPLRLLFGVTFFASLGLLWGYFFDFLGGGKRVENALCTLVFGCFSGYNGRKMHRKGEFTPYLYSRKVLEL